MTDTIYGVLLSIWFIDLAGLFVYWKWPMDPEVYLSDDWIPYGNATGRAE